MAEYLIQDTTLTGIADAIRGKTGETGTIPVPDMASKIDGIQTGGGGVSPKAVNFYDYDGTVLHAYTKEEFLALTEMPPLPEREGLICQEWNWSFEDMRDYTSTYGVCNAGATYTTDDGTTRIYITLQEGRTSPMLNVCPNGTVTVDWGDGTTPDVLTGTSTSTVKWTPNHEYASPGDYVIRLAVDGEMGFFPIDGQQVLSASGSNDNKANFAYRNAIKAVEIGRGVPKLGEVAFLKCYSLSKVAIPNSVTTIGVNAFAKCSSLSAIVIPNGVTIIGRLAFSECSSLSTIVIPNSVTSIDSNAFEYCTILNKIVIPSSVASINGNAFTECYAFSCIVIPDGVTSIAGRAFYRLYGARFIDFTASTSIPTLGYSNVFSECASDLQIRVPAALYDEWIAATYWSDFASQIVAV
jgi:hypothetical protein